MRKYRPILLLLMLVLFSCGLNNTMYNARKYFRAAQERPLNANGRANNQAVEEYTKAIKKCGIILSNPKTTHNTDDALFLMAQALYLKGNSAFQAKDQFEALIKNFPESPFYGEAHIFLAKVYREINRQGDAKKLLEEFIRDPEQKKMHPRALQTLAEFEIADKDYIKANYWLQKIITEYPKSNEYREAFFLFGKNYFIQKDYAGSQAEFEKLAQTRSIPLPLRLEARYYVALNQFLQLEFEDSWKNVQKLLTDEVRPDKVSQIRVLKARLLFARGKGAEGVTESEAISKDYPRTLSSSDAQYYLGEYYFHSAKDLDKALSAYNRVKAEFPGTELMDMAQRKATAISQLKVVKKLDSPSTYTAFVDYQTAAAENYFNHFDLPDSAWVMYQKIIDSRRFFSAQGDTLATRIALRQAVVDSLTVEIDLLPKEVTVEIGDSTDVIEIKDKEAAADTLVVADSLVLESGQIDPVSVALPDSLDITPDLALPEVPAVADSLKFTPDLTLPEAPSEADSLEVAEDLPESEILPAKEDADISEDVGVSDADNSMLKYSIEDVEVPVVPDSLSVAEGKVKDTETSPADSALVAGLELRKDLERRRSTEQTQLTALQSELESNTELLQRIDIEVIPLALFSQASIFSKTQLDSLRVKEIHDLMLISYPDNKYTNALGAMLRGEPIRLIDPVEQAQELELDNALSLYESEPDSMVVVLAQLSDSKFSNIRLKSNFRLGWFYTFEQPDTTLAKTYLSEVLKLERTGDYAALTSRFFDGTKFSLNRFNDIADSLELAALADSLLHSADSTAVADSLGNIKEEEKPASEETLPEIEKVGPGNLDMTDTPEKKEDPPPTEPEEEPTPPEGTGNLPPPPELEDLSE